MQRKNQQQNNFRQARAQPRQPGTSGGAAPRRTRRKRPTELGLAMREIGASMGGQFGGPAGAALGRIAGGALSRITGQGRYVVSQNEVGRDTTQAPAFSVGRGAHENITTIAHREMVTGIQSPGSVNFLNRAFNINAGNGELFPWLAPIAARYQKYRFRGLVFEFKSSSSDYASNAALGTVIMATNYNAMDRPFADRIAMENSSFACSAKPSVTFYHPVECATQLNASPWYYTRDGTNSVSATQLYDVGLFQLGLNGITASSGGELGELWATYLVDVTEPIIPPEILPDPGDTWFNISFLSAGAGTAPGPFGLTSSRPLGYLSAAGTTAVGGGTTPLWSSKVTSSAVPLLYTSGSMPVLQFFPSNASETQTSGSTKVWFGRPGVYLLQINLGETSIAYTASPWLITGTGLVASTSTFSDSAASATVFITFTVPASSFLLGSECPFASFSTTGAGTFGKAASSFTIVS